MNDLTAASPKPVQPAGSVGAPGGSVAVPRHGEDPLLRGTTVAHKFPLHNLEPDAPLHYPLRASSLQTYKG